MHFRGIKDHAVKMWGVLEGVHMQKQPGTHFNAYDDLFSIRKHEEEDLQSLINHVDDAVHRIRDLRSIGFTLDKLDDELASMTLIRAFQRTTCFCNRLKSIVRSFVYAKEYTIYLKSIVRS